MSITRTSIYYLFFFPSTNSLSRNNSTWVRVLYWYARRRCRCLDLIDSTLASGSPVLANLQ